MEQASSMRLRRAAIRMWCCEKHCSWATASCGEVCQTGALTIHGTMYGTQTPATVAEFAKFACDGLLVLSLCFRCMRREFSHPAELAAAVTAARAQAVHQRTCRLQQAGANLPLLPSVSQRCLTHDPGHITECVAMTCDVDSR